MRRAVALTAAALGLTACSAEFWDMNPPTHIPLAVRAQTLRIDRVEVRSSFYDPPDEFSAAFEPAFREGAACFSGTVRATAVVFIHELTRYSDLLQPDGRLRMGGPVDIRDARGRVIGRYPIAVDISAVEGDLTDRRRAAARAFGQALCEAVP